MVFYPNIVVGEGGELPEGALLDVNNLADLTNPAQARINLGAGTGDGDMLGVNNLSEITNAEQARLNIGAGTGDGDMLRENNLSDVLNPVLARQNIGAGTGDGDMVGANNLSEITDPAAARAVLGIQNLGQGDVVAANNLTDLADLNQARINLGAGTGDGDMVGANNLNDVTDPDTARLNIGAGTGNGDMLAANNLADVLDADTARANIGAGTGDLLAANNLSDIPNKPLARANLGIPEDIGQGNGDMLGANNLSDVDNIVIARDNLGLGSAALEDVGLGEGNVLQIVDTINDPLNPSLGLPALDGRNLTNLNIPNIYPLKANNLSDLGDPAQARINIGAGTGDGDMVAANNLSEVDPLQARTNIGAGTGDGDMLGVNNLSEIQNPLIARQNIGAGDGDMKAVNNLGDVNDPVQARINIGAGTGDMLGANNLSEIVDGAVARANIGAGIGDMLAANNLSEIVDGDQARINIGAGDMLTTNNLSDLTNAALAKTNINADLYGVDETLRFGSDTNNPVLQAVTVVDNNGYEIPTLQIERNPGSATRDSYLQIGFKDESTFEKLTTGYAPAADFSNYGGVLIRSESSNHYMGFVPRQAANMSATLVNPTHRIVGHRSSGGSPFLQLGTGGGVAAIDLAGGRTVNNRITAYNQAAPQIILNAREGSAITAGSFQRPIRLESMIHLSTIGILDTDFEAIPIFNLYRYLTLTASRLLTLPKPGNLFESGISTSYIIVKDESGDCNALNTIKIRPQNTVINGLPEIVLDQAYQSVTIYFSKERAEYFTI